MRLMGREIGVRLWHWAIRKKGTGDDGQDERQPKMATQGKEPTQVTTQIVTVRMKAVKRWQPRGGNQETSGEGYQQHE